MALFDYAALEEAEEVAKLSVYATSDLHTDHAANLDVLRALPKRPDAVLIVAGDISHDLEIVRTTFKVLKSKFREVFYCPGNHDLWVHSTDQAKDSLEKLRCLLDLCASLGVHTQPRFVNEDVLIVPMLSWYETGFDGEPDIDDDTLLPVEECMSDFAMCRWPNGLSSLDDSLATHVDTLNDDVEQVAKLVKDSACRVVISFSHFLPRPDLLPEKRFLYYPNLPKAVGSRALGRRVQGLQPNCHVFGHTHYGWAAQHDDTRYLQAALCYPRERTTRHFSVVVHHDGPEAVTNGVSSSNECEPLLVYDGINKMFKLGIEAVAVYLQGATMMPAPAGKVKCMGASTTDLPVDVYTVIVC
eukprot:TRINITY_DN31148_c1_g1_i1.p1 TRINITY_DN31148_c1_g1~~TRINITY_DN31148_c1_g1_i1.p1  ORF type:complete len:357 (+),score=47.72 TRINITY_DN31148_c1_g1_i1:88-1158(+)